MSSIPLDTLRPSMTIVDTADRVSTQDSDTRTPVTLTLGDLSGTLAEYERKTSEFSPCLDGHRLRLVGECALDLVAQVTDLVQTIDTNYNKQRLDEKSETMLDIPSSLYDGIRLENPIWHFDIRPKIRHTRWSGAELTAGHEEFSGLKQDATSLNRGLIFEGDMTDWTWGGFEGQSCRSIMFCPDASANAAYFNETETLVLSWKGKLYRSGIDVVKKYISKEKSRARNSRTQLVNHD